MKKYKIFVSRNEWIFIIVAIALLVALTIWFYVEKERNAFILLFQLPWIMVFLTQPRELRLHDGHTLELRSYVRNRAFKPISVNQLISYKRDTKDKNKITLVYYRDQLRGDWTLRLSEADIEDLTNELNMRNPAIIKTEG